MIFVVILFLATVLAPIIFWLLFFRAQDRADPEPKKLLIKVFFLGILAAFFAGIANGIFNLILSPEDYEKIINNNFSETTADNISPAIILMFVLAGPIEESIKYFLLKKTVYSKKVFNQIADGVIYGTTLALGFSFIENASYFISFLTLSTKEMVLNSMARGLATTLLHVISTGIVGFYIGKAKFSSGNKKKIAIKGLIIAATIHSLYNFLIFTPLSIFLMPVLVGLIIIIIKKLKKPNSQMIWKITFLKKKN